MDELSRHEKGCSPIYTYSNGKLELLYICICTEVSSIAFQTAYLDVHT